MSIEGNQCPHQAVDSLLADIGHIVKALQQVVSIHIRYILTDGRQRKNQTGILG